MEIKRACLATGIFLFGLAGIRAESDPAWQPAAAPIMTRWARDVSPARARPDYPRPQLVRQDWKSLNGLWEFGFDDANEGRQQAWFSGHALPGHILVPWTFEAALSGMGKGAEIHEHVWYRRQFDVPSAWTGRHVLLHFGAVDWDSTVWLNGKELGQHRGGYTPFSYDVTDALKPAGQQELVVGVHDPADPARGAYQPKGKQLGSKSIWYTRTTGIWQTVWLEPVADTYISGMYADPSTDGHLRIHVALGGAGNSLRLTASCLLDDKEVVRHDTKAQGAVAQAMTLRIPEPRLWSPETPTLYNLVLSLEDERGQVVDQVKSYTALRSVSLKDQRICLNGRPYFLRGVLDQGFWPDGIYTPPSDDAIHAEVAMTRALDFNLARKHVKVEDPRWYYYCDRLGLLVAQDMPSSHNLQPPGAKENFVEEWSTVVRTLRAHPSIILWIPFNENWGDPKEFQDRIVELTHKLDPTRPVIDASGWTQRSLTDIRDIHDYGNDLKKHARADLRQPTWIGEYGGVALPIPGHTWTKGWGYQTAKNPDELVDKYRFLTDQINEAPGLSGFVYTQLTDVEQELNGLLTYDRIPKADPKRFAAINVRQADKRSRAVRP
jgi:beta-galactosidase/beta-glucuronidase